MKMIFAFHVNSKLAKNKTQVIDLVCSVNPLVRIAENVGCSAKVIPYWERIVVNLLDGSRSFMGTIDIDGTDHAMTLFRLSISDEEMKNYRASEL